MARQNSKNDSSIPIRALDQDLIDHLYKELTKELSELIKELNDSSKIGAFGAMATLSNKVSEIAGDLKKFYVCESKTGSNKSYVYWVSENSIRVHTYSLDVSYLLSKVFLRLSYIKINLCKITERQK